MSMYMSMKIAIKMSTRVLKCPLNRYALKRGIICGIPEIRYIGAERAYFADGGQFFFPKKGLSEACPTRGLGEACLKWV